MKKIFLIAGILSFSSSFGQQPDIMDIQKYLQQKNSKEKNNIISPLSGLLKSTDEITGQTVYTLSNGGKVIKLPQDNMPCVITDLNEFNMPNIFSPESDIAKLLKPGNLPGKMPNVAHPAPTLMVK